MAIDAVFRTFADSYDKDDRPPSHPVSQVFTRSYDRAYSMFKSHQLENCAARCQKILDDALCPRYHYIKTRILQGHCKSDFYGAWECYGMAKSAFTLDVFHSRDAGREARHEELKKLLDELSVCIYGEVRKPEEATPDPNMESERPVCRCSESRSGSEKRMEETDEAESTSPDLPYLRPASV